MLTIIGMDGIAQTDRDVNAAPSPRRDYGKIAGVPEMVTPTPTLTLMLRPYTFLHLHDKPYKRKH